MSSSLQQQFVRDMLTESTEGLDRFDQSIVLLEQQRADRETLNDIFRVIHTLKGTAGCLGFTRIQRLAHAGENLLDQLRSDHIHISATLTSALLELSDGLRTHLRAIEADNREADMDHEPLAGRLLALAQSSPADSVAPTESSAHPEIQSAPTPPPASQAEPAAPAAEWGLFEEPLPPTNLPAASEQPTPQPVEPVARETDRPSSGEGGSTSPPVAPGAASASVRVDVGLLDRLMNLVGELVLARNQLVQVAQSRQPRADAVRDVSQRLNLVTAELQEGVMKTRMQPIGNVWGKFPRVVRDVARSLNKEVRLDTFGSETELDRTIIEAIRDPLTHIVRNSIDHGIESPDQRVAAGKPREGSLLMRAFHEGGQVNIEISDDGAGVDLDKVRRRALERGLIKTEDAEHFSERELTSLLFLPGFSTAAKVTNVSGRGVGMDVVKTNIEKIGGSVDITTERGQGTTLKIKIPLTLAIVPALIVRAGGERFAIPQVNLLELVRLDGEAARAAVEQVYGVPVFRLRGNLLPLVFLHRELKLPAPNLTGDSSINIVVLEADRRQFGLVVDEICDTEEIVVKPLGKHLKGLPMYAGATIMGDGRVALILDVLGLAEHLRMSNESHESATSTAAATASGQRSQLLLFSLPGRDRLALPLDQAARLEEFPIARIENTGGREAVQYRGRILPLLRLACHVAGTSRIHEEHAEKLQVIVYEQSGRAIGLVVGSILDIVEESLDLQAESSAQGILGSAIVQGRITDLVDIRGVLEAAGFEPRSAA